MASYFRRHEVSPPTHSSSGTAAKTSPPGAWAVSKAAGTATLAGLVGGARCSVVAAFLGGPTRMAFLALGLTLPLLMLQDSWRFAFFALGRGSQALPERLGVGHQFRHRPDLPPLCRTLQRLLVRLRLGRCRRNWGSGGTAPDQGHPQGLRRPREWLSRQRDLGFRYLVEGTSYSAAGLVRNYGIGLILGLTALGYIQAANTLMGPFQVILYGMALAALPEAIRILKRSTKHMMVFCVLCSVGLTLVALAWGVALLVALPRGLGQWLLGPIWRPTYELVLPMTFFMMGGCISAGAATYMRALGAARRSVRAAIFTSISFLVGSLVGAVVGGAVGAVYWRRGSRCSRFDRLLVATAPDAPRDAWHTHSGAATLERARELLTARCCLLWRRVDVPSPAPESVEVPLSDPFPRRLAAVRQRLVTNARLLVVASPTDPSSAPQQPNKPPGAPADPPRSLR